jgi:hypothetical protein
MTKVGEPPKRFRSLTAYSDSFLPPVKRLRTLDQLAPTISLRQARIIFLRGRSLTRQTPSVDQGLRKFAILNRIRQLGWTVPSPNFDSKPLQSVAVADEIVAIRLTTSRYFLPRSPLGLSNYEDLDQWNEDDDQFDYGDPGGSDLDEEDVFHSDFNFLDVDEEGSTDEEYNDSPFSIIASRRKPRNAILQQDIETRDCRMATCEQNSGAICCR